MKSQKILANAKLFLINIKLKYQVKSIFNTANMTIKF